MKKFIVTLVLTELLLAGDFNLFNGRWICIPVTMKFKNKVFKLKSKDIEALKVFVLADDENLYVKQIGKFKYRESYRRMDVYKNIDNDVFYTLPVENRDNKFVAKYSLEFNEKNILFYGTCVYLEQNF